MTYRVNYDPEAADEYRDAVAWYESRSEGLGVRFILETDSVIRAISSRPLHFSKVGRKNRKARILNWPYSVYFTVNETHSEVKIIAIWHGARNPEKLRQRLK